MRMLDLFCGRFGWGRAFAARGWEVVGMDLVEPSEVPPGCTFVHGDVLSIRKFELPNLARLGGPFDFIGASSPCEQFSLFGLRCFHPDPPYPELGIKLFNHGRAICERSGIPYILENVRSAEQFVGTATARCGPFALWGPGVPPLLPQGIRKGISIGNGKAVKGLTPAERKEYRKQFSALQMGSKSAARKKETAAWATIPPELANTVADYVERIIDSKAQAKDGK